MKPSRWITVWGLGLGWLPMTAWSAPLELSQAIENALSKSPEVRQLEEQLDSASAKKRMAFAPSEPTLQIGWNDLTSFPNFNTTSSNVFQLTQPIGFPGKSWLNHAQLGAQADAVSYQLKSARLQTSFNVKTAYYGLELAEKNIALNTDTRLSYERILAIAKRRYETGLTSQVDYLNAQVALDANENDRIDLDSAERSAREQLNVLLKNTPGTALEVKPIQPIAHPTVNPEEALRRMLSHRNEIKAAEAQSTAAGKAYQQAWMSVLPDFQLTVGTTFYRVPYTSPLSGGPDVATIGYPTHTYMVGLQMTVPIWFWLNEREAITGAAHDRAAAEAGLDVVYNQSKIALEQAVESLNALSAKIDNFEKHLLPLSEQSLSLALINYSSGKIDFQTLSDTAASRRLIRLNYATSVVNYLISSATYGQLIGEDL